MKRILVIVLSVCLLVGCMVISVSADSSEAPTGFGRSYIDLLVAPSYSVRVNNESIGSDIVPGRHIASSLNATSVSIRWNPGVSSSYYGYIFCLSSAKKPSSVAVYPFVGSSALSATLVGNQGNNYYYRYNGSSEHAISYITITATYSSTYSGYFALNNCFATYPSAKSLDFTDKYQISATESYGNTLDSFSLKSGGMTSFPLSYEYEFLSPDGVLNFTGQFDFDFTALESYSFIFETVGTVSADDVSFGVYTTAGVLKYLLPVEVIPGLGYWYDLGDGTTDGTINVRQNVYCVTVDLTGLDVAGYTSKLSVNVHPLQNPVGSYFPAAINITNFAFRQPVYSTPWYLNFYTWISNRMDLGFSSVVDAITGDAAMQEEADQMVEDAAEKQSIANNVQNDLKYEKPSVSVPSGDVGGMITGDGVAPLGSTLAIITNNSFVLKLLTLVFTLALCAYVFFGKRR